MSVESDDTDVLLLLPPDLYAVTDEIHGRTETCECLANYHVAIECPLVMSSIRRYGSADTLTPPSRTSLRSRSLHGTPVKYPPNSPFKNVLTSESYLTQKQRDEQSLREIDEYFNRKEEAECRENEVETNSPPPQLDLPQVQQILSLIDETEKEMTSKSTSERNEEAWSVRKALTFDSPIKSRNFYKSNADHLRSQLSIRTDDGEPMLSTWSTSNSISKTSLHEEMKILRQRVEEERLRRQHCEELIRELQKRLLESQEQVAVAVKVDTEKNAAIKKLRDSWSRAVEQWKDADSKRIELASKLKDAEQQFNDERNDLSSSVRKYEQELLKSLDLVHDYKEQQCVATKERDLAVAQVEQLQSRMDGSDAELAELNNRLIQKDEQIRDNNAKIEQLNEIVKDLKKQLKQLQTERDCLSGEKEAKVSLQKKLDEVLKRERQLQEQLRAASKTKADLKNYYQTQVENIVSEKQKDFQSQLENAEKRLLKQFEAKEADISEVIARERQQLIESHSREVNNLEETHRETVEYYKVELSLCKVKIDDIQALFNKEKERQRDLTQQLHQLFHNQWKETLKLVCPQYEASVQSSNDGSPLKRQNTFTKNESIITAGPTTSSNTLPTAMGSSAAGATKISSTHPPSVGSSAAGATSSSHALPPGSSTYRINETPQKIPNQRLVKDYVELHDFAKDKARKSSEREKSPWKKLHPPQ